jgi:hypothetical protein
MPVYTLWDTESARRIGEYTDIEDALDVVRLDIQRGATDLWSTGALLQLTGDDAAEDIVLFEGEDLVARARRAGGGTPPRASAIEAAVRGPQTDTMRVDTERAMYLPRIDLTAFGLGPSGMQSIAASLNQVAASQIPAIDIASYFTAPMSETIREFTQIRWSDHRVAIETPLAQILADSPVSQLIHAYATDSLAEMSQLVAEIARQTTTIDHFGTYLIPLGSAARTCILLHHQQDEDDVFTGIEEDEGTDNLVIFGQWRSPRARHLG